MSSLSGVWRNRGFGGAFVAGADFSRLARRWRGSRRGARYALDIMDGHFVPNFSFAFL